MFASTTCLMDNTRGKDSPISNAFIGGLAAGVVVGSKCESKESLLVWFSTSGNNHANAIIFLMDCHDVMIQLM